MVRWKLLISLGGHVREAITVKGESGCRLLRTAAYCPLHAG